VLIAKLFRPFPKYLQVREVLLRRLERDLRPGQQFPTEQALCAEFGISRETVREALRTLEDDGLISRHPGRGSFVLRAPRRRAERRLTGLVEDFSDLRLDTEARVLDAGPMAATADLAEAMALAAGAPLYRISRLRNFERRPLAFHDAFLPAELGSTIAALDLRHTSIMHELQVTLGLPCVEQYQRIEAIAADAPLARALETTLGAPLLQITRCVAAGDDRQPVLFRSQFRADRYYYTVDLASAQPAAPPSGRARRRP
jgi:GntR family transcriptional regulator